MRPPFVLETYRSPKINDKNRRLIVNKNEYMPMVKNHNWQETQDSWPFENEVENCRISHYKRLGRACFCYATTTSDMLKQIERKDEYVNIKPAQKLVSYFSFRDANACKEKEPSMFPEVCTQDYRTTTQKDYTPPYPCLPSAHSSKVENFLKNRRMKHEDPYNAEHMFWDEDIPEIIRRMQCKGHAHKSYDFCRGAYTDGSLPPEKKHKCIEYKSLYS